MAITEPLFWFLTAKTGATAFRRVTRLNIADFLKLRTSTNTYVCGPVLVYGMTSESLAYGPADGNFFAPLSSDLGGANTL